jgi:hypothetical protein
MKDFISTPTYLRLVSPEKTAENDPPADPATLLAGLLAQAQPASSPSDPCRLCQHRPVEQVIEGDGNVQLLSRSAARQVIRGNGNVQADLGAWRRFVSLRRQGR